MADWYLSKDGDVLTNSFYIDTDFEGYSFNENVILESDILLKRAEIIIIMYVFNEKLTKMGLFDKV